jgi:ATP-dependent DNA helicase RecG
LSSNQELILECIKKNPFISAQRLSGEIGISHRKIQENIQKLKEMHKLKRVGPDKGGHWEFF